MSTIYGFLIGCLINYDQAMKNFYITLFGVNSEKRKSD